MCYVERDNRSEHLLFIEIMLAAVMSDHRNFQRHFFLQADRLVHLRIYWIVCRNRRFLSSQYLMISNQYYAIAILSGFLINLF